MTLQPARGAKIGALTALSFAVITPINNLLRGEAIVVPNLITGSVFAFVVFGLIGSITDKFGVDVGEA